MPDVPDAFPHHVVDLADDVGIPARFWDIESAVISGLLWESRILLGWAACLIPFIPDILEQGCEYVVALARCPIIHVLELPPHIRSVTCKYVGRMIRP